MRELRRLLGYLGPYRRDLLIAAVMVSLAAGAYPVPLRDIPEVLLHAVFPGVFQAAPDPTAETVVIGLRLPRTVLAAIAGAGLAVSGAAFQTLFRNPLATPDTLGVATGASCGAALSLPEDEARSLGISVRRLRFTAILASALITSSIVALCGLVGWVGLLIPHAARMLFGGSVRRLIPGSVLLGALFLIAVDAGARMVFDAEIPVSVLTSLIGAPAFIYLLRKTGGVKA